MKIFTINLVMAELNNNTKNQDIQPITANTPERHQFTHQKLGLVKNISSSK